MTTLGQDRGAGLQVDEQHQKDRQNAERRQHHGADLRLGLQVVQLALLLLFARLLHLSLQLAHLYH